MWSIAAIAVFIAGGFYCSETDPVISTNVGFIRGRRAPDGDYDMYLGIPYAQVDKNNPFGDHIPQPPFSNYAIFDAVDDSAACPQIDEFTNTPIGTLDCLQLNVYVPASASPTNKLPVMVWIHGGVFQFGYKSKELYGPKYLVRHDVIVVSINYRLGPYGFMCLDIPEVSGNQGLKDQQAALRWVKNNIAAFGGNNNNIVIAGESAGAASGDFHLRYNKENTFHKVIMESGSVSSAWAILAPDRQLAVKVANMFGFPTDNSLDAVKFLATLNPASVIFASLSFGLTSITFPCVELEFDGVTRFVDKHPINIDVPRVKDTPVLLGANSDEMLGLYINQDQEFFDTLDIFKVDLRRAFNFTDYELDANEYISKLFYLGSDKLTKDKFMEIGKFDSDANFIYPARSSVEKYMRNGAKSVYNYIFAYSGRRNYAKSKVNTTVEGAFHADELGYLFDVYFLEEPNQEDQLMIDRMTTMWTNFIKYGDPTPEGSTGLLPVKWPKVTLLSPTYLTIDSTFTRIPSIKLEERMAFWHGVYLINFNKRKGYEMD